MKTWVFNTVLIAAMLCQQAGYLFNYFGTVNAAFKGYWYICNAGTHIILATSIYSVHVNWLDEFSSWTKPLTKYLLLLAANQFFDEVCARAMGTNWNEVILLAGILGHAFLKMSGKRHIKIRKPKFTGDKIIHHWVIKV